MADLNFSSGLDLEASFVELKQLVLSYTEVAGDGDHPLLFTLSAAIDRFEVAIDAPKRVRASSSGNEPRRH